MDETVALTPTPTRTRTAFTVVPGLALAVAVGLVATGLGRLAPTVGAPVFAILIGALIALAGRTTPALRPGLRVAARPVLQLAVVFFGFGLSFAAVASIGVSSLPVLAASLAGAFFGALLFGRLLGVGGDLRTLISVGTAICGASAIAATDGVLRARERDVSYAIATIFTFNVAAVLLFPLLGHALHLSSHTFGLWAGTAVNDVSSVVAAATSFGHGATSYAIVVKLARTLAIIPITLVLSLRRARAAEVSTGSFRAAASSFPWFILAFVAAVGVSSLGLLTPAVASALGSLATFMIAVALAGIGLSTDLAAIRRAGIRPLALGAGVWAVVAVVSLAVIVFTHH